MENWPSVGAIARTLTTIVTLEPIPTIQATITTATHALSCLRKIGASIVEHSKSFPQHYLMASTSESEPATNLCQSDTLSDELAQRKQNMMDSVQVFFMRNEYRAPVVCVAVILNQPKPEASKALFTVAVHNPRDPFDKALARHIAIERLRKYTDIGIVDFGGPGLHRKIAAYIAKHTSYPQRAREAAGLYLKRTKEITNDPQGLRPASK